MNFYQPLYATFTDVGKFILTDFSCSKFPETIKVTISFVGRSNKFRDVSSYGYGYNFVIFNLIMRILFFDPFEKNSPADRNSGPDEFFPMVDVGKECLSFMIFHEITRFRKYHCKQQFEQLL